MSEDNEGKIIVVLVCLAFVALFAYDVIFGNERSGDALEEYAAFDHDPGYRP